MHTTGWRTQQIQPITYIIGINKLGTLLSSQTTDTPGTTQTNVQDRSGATFQTYPIPRSFANPRSSGQSVKRTGPTRHQHAKKRTIFQAVIKGGWPLFFRFSGGDSENNTRPQPPPQIGQKEPPAPPKTPGWRGSWRHTRGAGAPLGRITAPMEWLTSAQSYSTFSTTSKSASRGFSRYGSRTPGPQAAVPTPLRAWST